MEDFRIRLNSLEEADKAIDEEIKALPGYSEQVNELSNEKNQMNVYPSRESLTGKNLQETLALMRRLERKRTLVAVADSKDEVMELLQDLTDLDDLKKNFEKELCQAKTDTYHFAENKKTDVIEIYALITKYDRWLDNYQATGKLEDVAPQQSEIETSNTRAEAVGNDIVSNAAKPITPLTGSRYVHKPPTIPPADYETWRKADLWTIERGILLLLNAETLPSRNTSTGRCKSDDEQRLYDDFMKIWAVAESSLKTSVLKKTDKSYPSLISEVLPSVFIYWATDKGYSIPIELKSINVMTQAEPKAIDGVGSLDERQEFRGGMMGFNFSFAEAQDFPTKARKLEALNTCGFAEAYDETAPKITRLTKYLELDTWTPEQAAFLVCGIDADYLHGQTLDKATSLADGNICSSNDFLCANRVLKWWNSQENPPAKVPPVDFVVWCKTKDIDTDWITNADEWPGYVLSQTQAVGDDGEASQDNDNSRESQFYALVWRVYQFLISNNAKATAQRVWDEIRYRHSDHDIDNIIDDVTADLILWTSKYGNESRQKRTTFNKTLSIIKNNQPN